MKVCAITMVYRDYWALSKWIAHYGKALGERNLFVVSHGHDPRIMEICGEANVLTVPRDTLTGFDRMRGLMLNSIQDGLGVAYDWVIRTDADELIFLDEAQHTSFQDLFIKHAESTAMFGLGLNIVQGFAVFSGHYSKAWAVRRGAHLMRHGVAFRRNVSFTLPRGVYLAHLKFADEGALEDANHHRREVATSPGKGLPGKAWSEAWKHSNRFLNRAAALEEWDWEDARDDAYDAIASSPFEDEIAKVIRARSIDFDHKAKLPDWITF